MARGSVAIDRGIGAGRKQSRPHPNLVLASEALKEDLAPLEPGRGAGRLGIGGVAVALALLGLAIRLGVGRGVLPGNASSVTLAAAGAAGAVAALPFSYSIRAGAAASLGFGRERQLRALARRDARSIPPHIPWRRRRLTPAFGRGIRAAVGGVLRLPLWSSAAARYRRITHRASCGAGS